MATHTVEDYVRDAEKSSHATQSASTDMYKTGVDLFRKGMECSIESQKQMLEVVSQLNAETVGLWRTMFGNISSAKPMFNFAEQTVDQFIEMQKRTLDIMGQQSTEIAESAKTQGERTARAAHEATELAKTQGERTARAAHEATESTTTQRERQKTA
jgi:hypothetical protein